MKEMFGSWWELVVKYRKPLTAIGLGVLAIIVVANAFFFGVAYFPKACVVCHYMDPFYDQWKTSKHASVASMTMSGTRVVAMKWPYASAMNGSHPLSCAFPW